MGTHPFYEGLKALSSEYLLRVSENEIERCVGRGARGEAKTFIIHGSISWAH